jgi:D-beta-D-heptose 7-phosphate kinase/D-beta-D-heptose 1-phosphate adenosyltransferase
LVGEQDRAMLLSALSCIDDVVLFSEDTPKKLLEQLQPDILVKGGDYNKEDVIGKESVKRVVILPFEAGYSTTNIIEKITGLVKENI